MTRRLPSTRRALAGRWADVLSPGKKRRVGVRAAALLAAPILHLMLALMAGTEMDGSGPMLFTSALAGAVCAFLFGCLGFGVLAGAAAAAWPPPVMVAFRLYWAMGVNSAGGGAQELVKGFGWPYAPGWAATALVLFLACVPAAMLGKLCAAFERWHVKRYGRSFFLEEEDE